MKLDQNRTLSAILQCNICNTGPLIMIFVLHFCLQGRCNVNVVESGFGTCPLAAAIFFQNFNVVDVLVKHGADINLPNNVGKTSLQFAVDVHATRGHTMKEEPYMAEVWHQVRIYYRGVKQTEITLILMRYEANWEYIAEVWIKVGRYYRWIKETENILPKYETNLDYWHETNWICFRYNKKLRNYNQDMKQTLNNLLRYETYWEYVTECETNWEYITEGWNKLRIHYTYLWKPTFLTISPNNYCANWQAISYAYHKEISKALNCYLLRIWLKINIQAKALKYGMLWEKRGYILQFEIPSKDKV